MFMNFLPMCMPHMHTSTFPSVSSSRVVLPSITSSRGSSQRERSSAHKASRQVALLGCFRRFRSLACPGRLHMPHRPIKAKRKNICASINLERNRKKYTKEITFFSIYEIALLTGFLCGIYPFYLLLLSDVKVESRSTGYAENHKI